MKWLATINNRFKLNLRAKLVWMCILLLTVPSVVIGFVGYWNAKEQLTHAGKEDLKDHVESTLRLISTLDLAVKKGAISLQEAQEQVRVEAVGPKQADGKKRDIKVPVGESGYLFALDSKGIEVMHPTIEGESGWDLKDSSGQYFTREIIKNTSAEGTYTAFQYKYPNSDKIGEKLAYSQVDPHWGWIVVAGAYLSEFDGRADLVLKWLGITLGISIVIGGALASLFALHLSRPLKGISVRVQQVAEGNLQFEPLHVKNRDEIGSLAADFDRMTEKLRDIIGQVTLSSQQVAATSQELTAGSEETGKATEHIATSIQTVAEGASCQAQIISEVNKQAAEIVGGISKISTGIQTAATSSEQASAAAGNGNQVILETSSQMHQIEETVNALSKVIHNLERKSVEIGDVISVITQITAQTNLLALNASIEASRAGEHGRGFAVVALEVRKLAEKSKGAAQQVASLIKEVQNEIGQAAEATAAEIEAVTTGLEMTGQAEEAFGSIAVAVDEVTAQARELLAAVQVVVNGIDLLNAGIEGISYISTETAGQAEGVAASAEQQNASMQEIAAAAASMSKMADDLQNVVLAFKI